MKSARCGVFAAVIGGAVGLLGMVSLGAVASAAPAEPTASCPIPSGAGAWAFHAGAPITGHTGTYAHGHGSVSAPSASGVICQVDRARQGPDRQIVLAVTKLINLQHAVPIGGALANEMRLGVRVKSSTDTKCRVGTHGTVTIIASYNGVHADSVQFSFPNACRRHRHKYSGPSVVALVPP